MLILSKKCLIEICLEILKRKKSMHFMLNAGERYLTLTLYFSLVLHSSPLGEKIKREMEELNTPKITVPSKQSLFCLIKPTKTAV